MRVNIILRSTVVAFATVGFLLSSSVQANKESLKGLDGVGVIVESFHEKAIISGFNKDIFQTDIELKLRLAGIKVLDETAGSPYLYLNVNASLAKQRGQYFPYSFILELNQYVYLSRDLDIGTTASTWNTGALGNGDLSFIREGVKDHVDKFINAYLSVNPK